MSDRELVVASTRLERRGVALEARYCAGVRGDRPCSALLFKVSPRALRPGAVLEEKCPKCGTFNYLIGEAD